MNCRVSGSNPCSSFEKTQILTPHISSNRKSFMSKASVNDFLTNNRAINVTVPGDLRSQQSRQTWRRPHICSDIPTTRLLKEKLSQIGKLLLNAVCGSIKKEAKVEDEHGGGQDVGPNSFTVPPSLALFVRTSSLWTRCGWLLFSQPGEALPMTQCAEQELTTTWLMYSQQ